MKKFLFSALIFLSMSSCSQEPKNKNVAVSQNSSRFYKDTINSYKRNTVRDKNDKMYAMKEQQLHSRVDSIQTLINITSAKLDSAIKILNAQEASRK